MTSPFILLCAAISILPAAEIDSRVVLKEVRDGVLIEDLAFRNAQKEFNVAYRVGPVNAGAPGPAILFVHWLDPSEPTSNRSQFLDEAVALAKKGVRSLLIDTLWSGQDWFRVRDPAKDRVATERQHARLKSALDFLLSGPNIDAARVAYVGHDFGGMFGAMLAAEERRVQFWAFQAATPRWHEWYLLGRKLDDAEKQTTIAATAPIDPIVKVAQAKGSFLLQFATKDPFVPKPQAEEFYAAAPDPKKILWYEAGHEMNQQATHDRIAWLTAMLKLK